MSADNSGRFERMPLLVHTSVDASGRLSSSDGSDASVTLSDSGLLYAVARSDIGQVEQSQLVTVGIMVRVIRILGSTPPLVSGSLVTTVTRSRSGTTYTY